MCAFFAFFLRFSLFCLRGENLTGTAALQDAAPKSVVALSKSIAEMWLLSGGSLSGTTADAMELDGIGEARSVGTLTTASVEAILSADPDYIFVVAQGSEKKKMPKKNFSPRI